MYVFKFYILILGESVNRWDFLLAKASTGDLTIRLDEIQSAYFRLQEPPTLDENSDDGYDDLTAWLNGTLNATHPDSEDLGYQHVCALLKQYVKENEMKRMNTTGKDLAQSPMEKLMISCNHSYTAPGKNITSEELDSLDRILNTVKVMEPNEFPRSHSIKDVLGAFGSLSLTELNEYYKGLKQRMRADDFQHFMDYMEQQIKERY